MLNLSSKTLTTLSAAVQMLNKAMLNGNADATDCNCDNYELLRLEKLLTEEAYRVKRLDESFSRAMINSNDELAALAKENKGTLTVNVDCDPANQALIECARDLVQIPRLHHSVIVPDDVQSIYTDAGHWLPALVFVPVPYSE